MRTFLRTGRLGAERAFRVGGTALPALVYMMISERVRKFLCVSMQLAEINKKNILFKELLIGLTVPPPMVCFRQNQQGGSCAGSRKSTCCG